MLLERNEIDYNGEDNQFVASLGLSCGAAQEQLWNQFGLSQERSRNYHTLLENVENNWIAFEKCILNKWKKRKRH